MARNGLAHNEPYLWDGRYLVSNSRFMHRTVYENAYGTIPDGMLVHHKNGIKTDNSLGNLELISKPDHCRLHKPRLGYRAPLVRYCSSCGNAKSERDLANNPHRKICWKCEKEEYMRRSTHVPSI